MKKLSIALLILIILIGSNSLTYYLVKQSVLVNDQVVNEKEEVIQTSDKKVQESSKYKLEKRFDNLDCDSSLIECKNKLWDQSLIFYDGKGGKETVVESIKDALPELKERFNLVLVEYSFPKKGNQLFFASIADATSSGYLDLYTFNTDAQAFSALNSRNEIWLSDTSMSPDGLKVVSAMGNELEVTADNLYQEGVKLNVLYLDKDKVTTVLEILENESFFESWADFGPTPISSINWLDNQTIEYSVYDSSAPFKPGDGPRRLIEKRQVKL